MSRETSGAGRPKVLVVDDDPGLLETTSALLSMHYDVECATSGEQALELCATRHYNVICTDYRMPGIDGLELLERVRAAQPEIWGVVVTGYREFDKTRRDGRTSFSLLFKPYAPTQLLETLENAVRAADIRRATAALSGVKPTRLP